MCYSYMHGQEFSYNIHKTHTIIILMMTSITNLPSALNMLQILIARYNIKLSYVYVSRISYLSLIGWILMLAKLTVH